MTPADETLNAVACAQCGAGLESRDLACASCGALRHAADLERFASEAKAAQSRADLSAARAAWTGALALLPPGTLQYRSVDQRVQEIDRILALQAQQQGQPAQRPMAKWAKRLGPVGILLWKAQAIGLLLLGKAKLVLLGLTKLGTLATMGLSFLFYWSMYGWQFGLGLVLSIFIHEMGHVIELRKFGIPASAPMFIPGFGALVMLKQRPPTPGQDARVGLAGPIFGLIAAALAYALYVVTGSPLWGALARFGAWINLFNLIPVWQLDGGRGFAALTRAHRGIILAVAAALWLWTQDGMLMLIVLGAAYRLFTKDWPGTPDVAVTLRYAALLAALGFLSTVGSGDLPRKPSSNPHVASISWASPASGTPQGISRSPAAIP